MDIRDNIKFTQNKCAPLFWIDEIMIKGNIMPDGNEFITVHVVGKRGECIVLLYKNTLSATRVTDDTNNNFRIFHWLHFIYVLQTQTRYHLQANSIPEKEDLTFRFNLNRIQ